MVVRIEGGRGSSGAAARPASLAFRCPQRMAAAPVSVGARAWSKSEAQSHFGMAAKLGRPSSAPPPASKHQNLFGVPRWRSSVVLQEGKLHSKETSCSSDLPKPMSCGESESSGRPRSAGSRVERTRMPGGSASLEHGQHTVLSGGVHGGTHGGMQQRVAMLEAENGKLHTEVSKWVAAYSLRNVEIVGLRESARQSEETAAEWRKHAQRYMVEAEQAKEEADRLRAQLQSALAAFHHGGDGREEDDTESSAVGPAVDQFLGDKSRWAEGGSMQQTSGEVVERKECERSKKSDYIKLDLKSASADTLYERQLVPSRARAKDGDATQGPGGGEEGGGGPLDRSGALLSPPSAMRSPGSSCSSSTLTARHLEAHRKRHACRTWQSTPSGPADQALQQLVVIGSHPHGAEPLRPPLRPPPRPPPRREPPEAPEVVSAVQRPAGGRPAAPPGSPRSRRPSADEVEAALGLSRPAHGPAHGPASHRRGAGAMPQRWTRTTVAVRIPVAATNDEQSESLLPW